MPDPKSTLYDEDEINLFEVLETLWREKLAILATAMLPLLAGLGLMLASPTTFDVKTPYYVQVAPLSAYDHICPSNNCDERMIINRVLPLSISESGFCNSGAYFELTTEEPKQVSEYQKDLAELNEFLRATFLIEAQTEKSLIDNTLSKPGPDLGIVATDLLSANRIIHRLQEGNMPLTFGPISITKAKKSFFRFAFAPALFGALAGGIFVVFRKASRDFRTKRGHIEH